jgi:hypothetical protein
MTHDDDEAVRLARKITDGEPGQAPATPVLVWDLARAVLAQHAELEVLHEQNAGIPALLANNDRLTTAINEMPEWSEAVNAASSAELIRLREALKEALDGWEDLWTSDYNEPPPRRIAELRKLTEG